MSSNTRPNENGRLQRQLNRITPENPDISQALQGAAEIWEPLDHYLPDQAAQLLMNEAAGVHLNPVLYLWTFLGFAASLLSCVKCSLRGNETSGLSLQVSIAANIGGGKSVSSGYVKKHFVDALDVAPGLSSRMIVKARGSIQGITKALAEAMKGSGCGAVLV